MMSERCITNRLHRLICYSLVFFSSSVSAQNIVLDYDEGEVSGRKLILPYAFYAESLEFTLGAIAGTSGYLQPQTNFAASVFTTSNKSNALFLSLNSYQLPFAKRVFIDFIGSYAYYTDQRVYTGFNADFPGEHGGSNDSSDDNFLQGEGDDDWYELKFKYLLPIGYGKSTLINKFMLKHGLLVDGQTGGDAWSPMTSGRTNFVLSIFKRHRTILEESGESVGDSEGIITSLEYDNRDFYANPTKGSLQKITLKHDFGIFEGTDKWSVIQLDLRKYIYLGATDKIRQSVLALDYWTSYTPSWNPSVDSLGPFIDGRPPNTLGSSLGGFYRLRAYPVDRFSDKAAIYYSAELRLMPKWNPLGNMKILKPLNIDWWQVVPFVEIGRVAPKWSFSELHTDMRKVLGVGLRFMAQKAVFRLDTAFADDSWSMYVMVGHPF
jgi:hypothetical protein